MLRIKDWFLNKNFDSNKKYVIETSELVVLIETEKAVQISTRNSDFGNIVFWCPKSCLEESEANVDEKNKQISSINKYEELKSFAKDNGIKVTAKITKKNLLSKFSLDMLKKANELKLISDFDLFTFC